MDMNGNTKWILSLIGLFILIAVSLGGYAVGQVDDVEKRLANDYVQKVDCHSNIYRIESGITRLNDKMDETNQLLSDKMDSVLRELK